MPGELPRSPVLVLRATTNNDLDPIPRYDRRAGDDSRSIDRDGKADGNSRPHLADTDAGEIREIQFFERAGRVPVQPAPFARGPFADKGSAAIDGNRSG